MNHVIALVVCRPETSVSIALQQGGFRDARLLDSVAGAEGGVATTIRRIWGFDMKMRISMGWNCCAECGQLL